MSQLCFAYDGTFEGFLTCVFYAYADHVMVEGFRTFGDESCVLWPIRDIETEPDKARRVYCSMDAKIGQGAGELVWRAFLTFLPDKEMHIYRFLRYGYQRGSRVLEDLGDQRVYILNKAVRHLNGEVHLLTGFIRFSNLEGVLVAEIEPKNRVLPLLRRHFVARYNTQPFLIYDRTHKEMLIYQPRQWAIVPMEDVTLPPPDEQELRYRRLWRRFYDTIEIQGRHNPKLRQTHMPRRYWNTMTEFQPGER